MTRHLDALTAGLEAYELEPGDVVDGEPETAEVGFTTVGDTEVGIWQITAGTVADVEKDEAFVVLTGSGTITFDDGEVVELGPGSLVRLHAGERTIWRIHETLRKVYVV